jgi:formylmethanofuran dehydrogenase subunit E
MTGATDRTVVDRAVGYRTSQVDAWITCDQCGELVLKSRTQMSHGETVCVPCHDRQRAEHPMRRRRPEAMAGV